MVDTRTLDLESIAGVRRQGGGDLPWKDLKDATNLLSNIPGWLNHCVAPVFHVKTYRKGGSSIVVTISIRSMGCPACSLDNML